ncbi:MAG: hypothetical protein PHC77_08105, partial [Candidatus Marinimicrobia bacterium]|nr:hypothetical protein [Candidatus Neomarinimicrobiota bacterium]
MFVYTGYPGYPLEIVDTETSLICIEGLIYNKSRETIAEEISHIERSFRDDLSCKETIRRFIQKSHGAYIVTVFLKDRQRLLLFADAWSRLKAYYYHDPKQLILSREHLFILNKIPEIRIDKMALSEFIILQYTLDHKTLLNDVNKTSTGFLLSAELRENSIHKMQDSLFSADFSTEKNVSAPQVCIEQSVALFLESIADIKNKLEELHYPITADLSGGYDSRAIFFGLNKMKVRADYYSDRLITGDESGVARKVADLCGQKISVIEASHTLDLDDLLRITYITGSNVNAITALVGYQDARARKKVCKEKSVKVGGFGGEYIRHPYHKVLGYVSIASMLKDEIFIRGLNVRHTAGLLKTNINTLIGNFRHYLERYEEKTVSDKIKHFYFDYYNNLVNLGEDRSRIHFWTVQPFMENTLLSYFIRAIPARYTSKKFFISFMAALDKRSLKAPIYGSKINLESRR